MTPTKCQCGKELPPNEAACYGGTRCESCWAESNGYLIGYHPSHTVCTATREAIKLCMLEVERRFNRRKNYR